MQRSRCYGALNATFIKEAKVGHHKRKAHFPRGDAVTTFTTLDPPPRPYLFGDYDDHSLAWDKLPTFSRSLNGFCTKETLCSVTQETNRYATKYLREGQRRAGDGQFP